MIEEITNKIDPVVLRRPTKATATVTSTVIDRQLVAGTKATPTGALGFNALDFLVQFGVPVETIDANNYWTIQLKDSPDNNTFTLVDAAYIVDPGGAHNVALNTNATPALSVTDRAYHIGYVGAQRYVEVVVVGTGTHTTGTEIGIVCLRGLPAITPTSSVG